MSVAATLAVPATSARILVVDDEVPQMNALCDTLRDSGYDVTGFSDPAAALVTLEAERFDLLLSDMMMPGVDGITVLRQAHALDPDLIGIIMTGQGSISTAVEAMKAGAFDYILKPFKLSVILPVLVRALSVRQMRLENTALQDGLRQRTVELEEANRELKEAQVRLLQSEKMASLGQLVAGIAHEVNNPLAFVISSVQTIGSNVDKILEPLEGQLDEHAQKRARKVRTRVAEAGMGLARVQQLVAKLKTFSRLDAGEFGTYDIPESVDAVMTILSHRLDYGIQVTQQHDGRRMLDCYGGELNQVFMNIISNALDAIDGHGRIDVRTFEDGGSFVISIRDSGCGMSADTAKRIFEPFFTTKPVGAGTGMGLSISYGIVRAHDGTIEVNSAPGKGTEFVIRIPLDLKDRRAMG